MTSARKLQASVAAIVLTGVALWGLLLESTDWTQVESVREVLKRGYQYIKLDLAVLSELAAPLMETIFIALGGTTVALVIVAVLWKISQVLPPTAARVGGLLVRPVLRLSEFFHELVWGLLLVALLGPSPAVGIAALALRSLKPLNDGLAAGDRPAGRQRSVALALQCFGDNLGRAAVLGLVGVGGLGLHFYERLASYQFGATAVTLLAVIGLILLAQLLLQIAGIRSLRQWRGIDFIASQQPTEAADPGSKAAARSWAARGSLVLIIGLILLSPWQRATGVSVIGTPGDLAAFLLDLVYAAGETVQMNLAASVLGVIAMLALGLLNRVPSNVTRPFVSGVLLVSSVLLLAVPAVFLALLGRAVLTVGPLAGTLALAIAAAGIASRTLAAPEADTADRTSGLESILSVFGALLPVTVAVGIFGAGGIGWQLRLSLLAGETTQSFTALVTIVLLIAAGKLAAASTRRGLTNRNPQSQSAPAASPAG